MPGTYTGSTPAGVVPLDSIPCPPPLSFPPQTLHSAGREKGCGWVTGRETRLFATLNALEAPIHVICHSPELLLRSLAIKTTKPAITGGRRRVQDKTMELSVFVASGSGPVS